VSQDNDIVTYLEFDFFVSRTHDKVTTEVILFVYKLLFLSSRQNPEDAAVLKELHEDVMATTTNQRVSAIQTQ